MMVLDLSIISIPKMDLAAPYVGPALLKAVCEEHGLKVKCIDLNIELYQFIGESYKALWLEDSPAFEPEYFDLYESQIYAGFISDWVEKILKEKPRYVGISCITFADREFSHRLAREIKKQDPNQKILIGGTDAENRFKQLKSENLVDDFILGDAEDDLIQLLTGSVRPKNTLKISQRKSLEDIPVPDYSDFDFSKYSFDFYDFIRNSPLGKTDFSKERMLYITSSRGCVRSCNFCDIEHYWKKYVYKNGKLIADEMYLQYQKHGIRYFYFTDSLINGDLKNLKLMCEQLISLQKKFGIKLFWRAQFIVLRKELAQKNLYQLMYDAGCDLIVVGVESGSESVRNSMNKKFSNEDFFTMMDYCENVGIRTGLLFLVGYPTETDEFFEETLDLIRNSSKYKLIEYISIGHTLQIADSTPLFLDSIQQKIDYTYFDSWETANSNIEIRVARLLKLKKLCNDLWFKLREPRTDFLLKLSARHSTYTLKIDNEFRKKFQFQRTRVRICLKNSANKSQNIKLFLLYFKLIYLVVKKSSFEELKKLQSSRPHNSVFSNNIVTSLLFLSKEIHAAHNMSADREYLKRLESLETMSAKDAYRSLFYIRSSSLYKSLFEDLYIYDSGSALQSCLLLCSAQFEDWTSHVWIDNYETAFGPWNVSVPTADYEKIMSFIEDTYFEK